MRLECGWAALVLWQLDGKQCCGAALGGACPAQEVSAGPGGLVNCWPVNRAFLEQGKGNLSYSACGFPTEHLHFSGNGKEFWLLLSSYGFMFFTFVIKNKVFELKTISLNWCVRKNLWRKDRGIIKFKVSLGVHWELASNTKDWLGM